ncbi:response regulator transcription factor [Mycolicibacterium fortuitum]|uniref:response regulator transcription factor n=1 Tax=Mycolicibacterium fortuitum TaxID=1766 RepID=UPI003AF4A19E
MAIVVRARSSRRILEGGLCGGGAVSSVMAVTVGTEAEVNLKLGRSSGFFRFTSESACSDGSVSVARVLVVEDAEVIREMVGEALCDAGYAVAVRPDGDRLEEVLEGFRPDLVVLDIMLPGRDGFALVEVVRRWGEAGVVLLTARDALSDRLRGLDGGADDYVVKPFELAELVSRVGSVLRRLGRLPRAVQVGDLVVDLDAGVATRAGRPLELTGTELRLLDYLVAQRGRIVSSSQILAAVWGYDAYDPNLVQVHMSGLRRKLEAHGPRIVETVRGLGYRLQASAS